MHSIVNAAVNLVRSRGRALFLTALLTLIPLPVFADEGSVVLHFSKSDTSLLVVALALGFVAVGVALFIRSMVMAEPAGSDKMQEVGKAIREGALAYLRKQIQTMAVFVVIIAIGLFALFFDKQ